MRIAYVITRADSVGGASIHVRDLAAAVLEHGHEPCVFVGGRGPVTEQLEARGIPHRSLRHLARSIHPSRDMHAYTELRRALADFGPDLVSTHTAKAGWLGRAAARWLGIPVIYTPHGWSISDRITAVQGRVYTVAERLAARWADAIVCVSQSERRLAVAKNVADAHQLHVIYNGVRDSPLRAEPQLEPVRMVSIARFEPPKDHATLFAALERLQDLPWKLALIGDGPLEQRFRAGASERIEFLGYQADPADELASSQLYILSSRSEGLPRSILEGMRAGLPVVASDVGGVAEAVAHGSTGLLVPPGDPAALAGALRRLINSPSERQLLGTQGRLRYQERFRAESMISNTLALYATIVGVGSPR